MSLREKLEEKQDDLTHTPNFTEPTHTGPVGHAVALDDYEDGSEAWHAARKKGIGGSDAGIVLGLNKWTDREELWRTKTGRQEPDTGYSHATSYGSRLEPYVRQYLRQRASDTPAKFRRFEGLLDCPVQLHHPEHTWMRGNTDGLLADKDGDPCAILEVKTGKDTFESFDGPTKPHHFPQVQHYLAVTGLDCAVYVYVQIPFSRGPALQIDHRFIADDDRDDYWLWMVEEAGMTITTVARDDEYIERMIGAEGEFWQCVRDDVKPDPILPEGEIEVDDGELARLLDEYGRAHARIKATSAPKDAKDTKARAKEAIKERVQAIATSEGGAKKVWVKGTDDYVTWNARGYWMAKPAERTVSSESSGGDDDFEVPF